MPLGVKVFRPDDAREDGNGLWTRPVTRYHPDGKTYESMQPCCERCWEPMPAYVGSPYGFVSADSARKLRHTMNDGRGVIEARPKCVCYECLKADAADCNVGFSEFPVAIA